MAPLRLGVTSEWLPPPVDVGGLLGYLDFLKIVLQPDSDQVNCALDWTETHFNPELFRRSAANIVHRVSEEAYGAHWSHSDHHKQR